MSGWPLVSASRRESRREVRHRVRRITETHAVEGNELDFKRQFAAVLRPLGNRFPIEKRLRVPDKILLFLFFSLSFFIAATTYAQTIPDAKVLEAGESVDHARVVIMVPNVTCYGRFQDSLKEHLQDKHDWIHAVKVSNTGRVRNPGIGHGSATGLVSANSLGELAFDIGTIAELTFTIDSTRSTRDLLQAIKDTKQYSLKHWTVQVELGVEEVLSRLLTKP